MSSGSPPAAVAVVRISGPAADRALQRLAGRLPEPRRASLVSLRSEGDLLDRGLAVRFPGPATATGEDVVELHLHGGRSVVAAVLDALAQIDGLRSAEPGEFTRRAFENGRIDLSEAEGLADLLVSETQSQRRAALALAGGALGRQVEALQGRILELAAAVEALLDFSDEGDVAGDLPATWHDALARLIGEITTLLARPPVERLRDGVKVVIAGPPNAGKSSLINAITGRDAAIISEIAGTTRDLVEAPAAIGGTPFLLVDTAGLRESRDRIEAIGVERARGSIAQADILLWLADPADCPDRERAIIVHPKADLGGDASDADVAVSARTGEGLGELMDMLVTRARALLPAEGEVAVNARHRQLLAEALEALEEAAALSDPLLVAEALRVATRRLDRITGRAGVEDMLDSLFSGFCIGK